jgi:hypothetical protein
MNRYIVFYQSGEDESSRDYDEINANNASEAESQIAAYYPDKNIISIWERV